MKDYDPCNYANGQVAGCGPDTDPVHEDTKADLNPGAVLGSVYEYMAEPGKNEIPSEFVVVDALGADIDFVNKGKIGSDTPTLSMDEVFRSWENPAFIPMAKFLNKHFFVNKP